jgi:hypothetical protein
MDPVEWAVLSSEKPSEAQKTIQSQGAAICLSPRGYEAMSRNMADILRYLQQVDALLDIYERERKQSNELISEENK